MVLSARCYRIAFSLRLTLHHLHHVYEGDQLSRRGKELSIRHVMELNVSSYSDHTTRLRHAGFIVSHDTGPCELRVDGRPSSNTSQHPYPYESFR